MIYGAVIVAQYQISVTSYTMALYHGWRRNVMDEYRRRNNVQDMTIVEQIIKAREEICKDYCKYVDSKHHGKLSQRTLDEICKDCPLSRI